MRSLTNQGNSNNGFPFLKAAKSSKIVQRISIAAIITPITWSAGDCCPGSNISAPGLMGALWCAGGGVVVVCPTIKINIT